MPLTASRRVSSRFFILNDGGSEPNSDSEPCGDNDDNDDLDRIKAIKELQHQELSYTRIIILNDNDEDGSAYPAGSRQIYMMFAGCGEAD
jgi:hypothetical protein